MGGSLRAGGSPGDSSAWGEPGQETFLSQVRPTFQRVGTPPVTSPRVRGASMRRAVAVPFAFVAALGLALAVPAGAATPTLAPSYGTVLNILPPGSQGRMNAVEAAK